MVVIALVAEERNARFAASVLTRRSLEENKFFDNDANNASVKERPKHAMVSRSPPRPLEEPMSPNSLFR
jgi:hypothetical protein